MDLTPFIHPGDIVYTIALVTIPENLSDGSNWLLLAAVTVFLALGWEIERQK